MSMKKSDEIVDAEIAKVIVDMSKFHDRYDKLVDKLKIFQE